MPGVGKVPARSLLLNILDQFQNLLISFVWPLLRMDLSSASEEDNPSFDVRVEELLQNRPSTNPEGFITHNTGKLKLY